MHLSTKFGIYALCLGFILGCHPTILCGCVPVESTTYGVRWQWVETTTTNGLQTPATVGETRSLRTYNDGSSDYLGLYVNDSLMQKLRLEGTVARNDQEGSFVSRYGGKYIKFHGLPYVNSVRWLETTDLLPVMPTAADRYVHKYNAKN